MSRPPTCEERSHWKKLVTPQLTRGRPVYGWFVFPHSFDKALVEEILQELAVSAGASVWDPFVGAGTTVLTCRDQGIVAWGSDLLPLSVLVTQAKTAIYDIYALQAAFEGFSYNIRRGTRDRFADVPVIRKAIPARIRLRVSSLLDQIGELDEPARSFFTTALISVLERCSHAVKSGGWLRIDESKAVQESDVRLRFTEQVGRMLNDIREGEESHHLKPVPHVWLGDARSEHLPTAVDAIITSPPYLNRHDYTRVFALELALIGVANADELKALRYRALRSHVEAQAPQSLRASYRVPRGLDLCLQQIEQQGANDRRVPGMIRGYFEDMFHVLLNAGENLRAGGGAAFVLGDVRFSGTMVPVIDLTVELGRQAGLTPEKVIIARYRGNSSQQMGTYGRERAREGVVIFRK